MFRKRRALLPLVCGLALTLGAPTVAAAQSSLLRGLVVQGIDERVVGHVVLTITRTDGVSMGRTRSIAATTNDFGYFQYPPLPPGRYTITIALPPFRPHIETVTVLSDWITSIIIRLVLRDEERIDVVQSSTATTTLLMPDGSIGGQFSREAIGTLPETHGRTVQSMLALVPGIVFTDSVGTLAQFTAAGQRRFANRMTIDGVSADLAVNPLEASGPAASGSLPAFATSGGTQTLVSQDGIQEITVRTSAAGSEFARAPGAQTSIVTRGGTDRFTATTSTHTRPNGGAASDWFANAGLAPESERHLWGTAAAAGGPLRRGRAFYFATWERQRIVRDVTTVIDVPSQSVRDNAGSTVRPLLDAFPRPNGLDTEDGFASFSHRFPVRSRLDALSLRADIRAPRSHQFFVRANYGCSGGDAISGGDGISRPYLAFSRREAAAITTATAGWTSTPSSAIVNEFRINGSVHEATLLDSQAPYGDAAPLPLSGLISSPVETTWFLLAMSGANRYVANGPLGSDTAQRQLQLLDTVSFVHGQHQWRLGFDYTRLRTATTPASHHYTYQYDTIDDLLEGRALFAELVRGLPARIERAMWSAFAQHTVRLTSRLTVGTGMRYDVRPAPTNRTADSAALIRSETLPEFRFLPSGSPLWTTARWNLAPRVSATYQLRSTPTRETVVSGAWGVTFDDAIPPGASPFASGYPFRSIRALPTTRPVSTNPVNDAPPEPFAPQDRSTYFAIPRHLKTPKTYQWHVGVEQALPGKQRLALSYAGAAGRDLIYSSRYIARAGGPFVQASSNDGRASYQAALVEYLVRPPAGQLRITYSWSHALDNQSEAPATGSTAPPMFVPPALNYASADFDRRHVFEIVGTLRLPSVRRSRLLQMLSSDWQIDMVGHLRSGTPFNVAVTRSLVMASPSTSTYSVRPDLLPGMSPWVSDSSSPGGRRLDPAAFYNTQEPRQGTLGRNAFRTAPLRQLDVALSRTLRLGERRTAQIRVDGFNVFNTPHFGRPDPELLSPVFGQPRASYADALGTGALVSGGLTPLQQLGGPRSIQIGLRLGL